MNLKSQHRSVKPAFNRLAVFAEVEKSNFRFENYSKDQRRAFAKVARASKMLSGHEVRRA
jgi:hypothetical protein